MPSDLRVVQGNDWVAYANSSIGIPTPNPDDPYILGITEPTFDNMGAGKSYLPDITTIIEGNLTLSTPGQVVANTLVNGIVKVLAPNVILRNVMVVGPAAANQEIYLIINKSTGLVLEHVSMIARNPSSYINGLGPRDFTAKRIYIAKVVDGIRINPVSAGQNVNVLIEGGLIEDFAFFDPDLATPSHTDGTHDDAVQIEGGNGAIIRGLKLVSMFSTEVGTGNQTRPQALSGLMLNQTPRGNITNLLVEMCIFSGAVQQINGGSLSSGLNTGIIRDNKFVDNLATGYTWHVGLDAAATGIVTSNNTIYGTVDSARITRSA